VVGLLAYPLAWATGLAVFQPPLSTHSRWYVDSAAPNLLASLLLSTTFGTVINCLGAFGEEVGWRGYMLTRLFLAGAPKPVLTSGVIWALWHVPMILSGQYAAGHRRWLSAILFVAGVLAEAYLAAYVRLRSGSVWPAVILHGAWNAVIQGTFDRATTGAPAAVGESGWLTVTFAVAFTVVVTRGVWTLQRRPGERLAPPSGKPPSILTL
jgi:membrane protease YdiL (CAAX protease family)